MAQFTAINPALRVRRVPRTSVVYFFGALGALVWGYDNGVIAGALLYIKPEFHLTPTETGLIGSFLSVGSALGAILSGLLADRIGRKRLIFLASIVFLVGVVRAVTATGTPSPCSRAPCSDSALASSLSLYPSTWRRSPRRQSVGGSAP